MTSFSERLREAIGHRSIRDVAAASGVAEGTIRKYLRGEAEPIRPTLVALSNALDCGIGWLASGQARGHGFFCVPYLKADCFSPGQYEFHRRRAEEASKLLFDPGWLESITGYPLESLRSAFMEGDSMEREIRDGTFLVIGLTEKAGIPQDGIYALRLPAGLVIRRLQGTPDGKVRIIADNYVYISLEVDLGDLRFGEDASGGMSVIGRVAWIAHRL